jgi:hypothetical protein
MKGSQEYCFEFQITLFEDFYCHWTVHLIYPSQDVVSHLLLKALVSLPSSTRDALKKYFFMQTIVCSHWPCLKNNDLNSIVSSCCIGRSLELCSCVIHKTTEVSVLLLKSAIFQNELSFLEDSFINLQETFFWTSAVCIFKSLSRVLFLS